MNLTFSQLSLSLTRIVRRGTGTPITPPPPPTRTYSDSYSSSYS